MFGIKSDTYDVMGIPEIALVESIEGIDFNNLATKFTGKLNLYYPPFSSKPVNGKPLFAWAKSGKLDEIELPTSEYEITTNIFQGIETISLGDAVEVISERIAVVKGDFRQEEIVRHWNKLLHENEEMECQIASFKANVKSGAYIRVIAHEMGKQLSGGALAWNILRTKVGPYELEDSIRI